MNVKADPILDELLSKVASTPDNPALHYELAMHMHKRGDAAQVLQHIENAPTTGEHPDWVNNIHASALQSLGRASEARSVIHKMVRKKPDDSGLWFRMALLCHQEGDHKTALTVLSQGLSAHEGDPPEWVVSLRSTVLQAVGQYESAALVLLKLARTDPPNQTMYRRAIRLFRQAGQHDRALGLLAETRVFAPYDPDLLMDHLDILQETDEIAKAQVVIRTVEETWPEIPLPVLHRKAEIARLTGDTSAAVDVAKAVCELDPDKAVNHTQYARALTSDDRLGEGIEHLEQVIAEQGLVPDLVTNLLALYRQGYLFDRLNRLADRSIAENPTEPGLLRFLFNHMLGGADGHSVETIIGALKKGDADPDMVAEFEVSNLLRETRFKEAFAKLYPATERRNAVSAMRLADSLSGQHQYALALRYLQFCIRAWPKQPGFLTRFGNLCLRLGQYARLARVLKENVGRSAELDQEILARSYALALHQDRLSDALAFGRKLVDNGLVGRGDPGELIRLVFMRAPSEQTDVALEFIKQSSSQFRSPHYGGTLNGQIYGEYVLEMDARRGCSVDTFDAAKEHAAANPDSTPRALAMIRAWRADGATPLHTKSSIPRHVVQFWNTPEPPEAVQAFMKSWSSNPDVGYTLFDFRKADKYLHDSLGARWQRAFRLARNHAESADFFRLAYVMNEGGIWADADDVLFGSLEALLQDYPGAVVYHESFGGAVGNNFFAAPPKHPAIRYAALMALEALEQRSAEKTWLKTGPGLFSRAIGQFVAQCPRESLAKHLTMLEYSTVAGEISMHNDVFYKGAAGHWNGQDDRQFGVWSRLAKELTEKKVK